MKENRTPEEEITALRRQYYARKRDAEEAARRASGADAGTEEDIASILGDEEAPSARSGKVRALRAAAAGQAAGRASQAALRLVRAKLKYKTGIEEAISILNEMANRNETKAILVFAKLFEKGGLYTQDYGKARECLEWAEELGDPEADFQLGRYYRLGLGVTRDDETAVNYFERASRGGVHKADYQLAALYFQQGSPRAAVRRLELAAVHRVPGARYDYAMCLLYGDGVKADPAKAVQILEESSADGDPEAAEKLAFLYDQGFRVKADPERAAAFRARLANLTGTRSL